VIGENRSYRAYRTYDTKGESLGPFMAVLLPYHFIRSIVKVYTLEKRVTSVGVGSLVKET